MKEEEVGVQAWVENRRVVERKVRDAGGGQ